MVKFAPERVMRSFRVAQMRADHASGAGLDEVGNAPEPLALILFLPPLTWALLLPLAWSPWPGNIFFATLGAQDGLRAGWPALLGYPLVTWGVTPGLGSGLWFSGRDRATDGAEYGGVYVLRMMRR